MTDHLGNVLATVLDRKTGAGTRGTGLYDHWSADLASTADYYPGGMMMPGRNTEYSWSRFGAQKSAKDDMTDHLGNVLATVLDRKTGVLPSGGGTLLLVITPNARPARDVA